MMKIVVAILVLMSLASMALADGSGIVVPGYDATQDQVVSDQPSQSVAAPASHYGTGTDISEMISATTPLHGKCAAIAGQQAFVLIEDTQATVYFRSKGWISGYLRRGDVVFIDSAGEILRAGRCGNPAKGHAKLPCPPKPVIGPRGPAGRNGYNGAPGAPGDEGPQGPQGVPGPGTVNVTNNTSYNCAQQVWGSCPLGGNSAPIVTQSQPVSVSFVRRTPPTVINVMNINTLVGVNTNLNGQVTNLGSGSAAGHIAGTGTGIGTGTGVIKN